MADEQTDTSTLPPLDSQGQRDYEALLAQGMSHQQAYDRASVRTRTMGFGINSLNPTSRAW